MKSDDHSWNRYFDAMTPAAAEQILSFHPDADVVARIAELGEKSNAGTITDAEREEYRALAEAGTASSLLKAKARSVLGLV